MSHNSLPRVHVGSYGS